MIFTGQKRFGSWEGSELKMVLFTTVTSREEILERSCVDLVVGQFSVSNNVTDPSELLQAPSASTRRPLLSPSHCQRHGGQTLVPAQSHLPPWLSSFVVAEHPPKPCGPRTAVKRTQGPKSPPLEHHNGIREKGTDTQV